MKLTAKNTGFIYRFIGAGTIEEKIFQRQSHKQSISNCVVDEATDMERHFSLADMRQLFQLNTESDCETHDTFKCKAERPLSCIELLKLL